MDSPGFVWLLSHSSWFCLTSTTRLIQIRSRAEHRISFLRLCRSSLHGFSWFCVASFSQLLVLFGFYNSLNTNPKRSGTPDFILTFERFAWILSWFLWLLSHNSWFCLASTTRLIQIRNGAEHRILFLIDSPGFVRLLSRSSWFCLASTTRLIQIRNGAEHQILFLLLNSLHGFSPGFCGFFPTTPGFVWLPQFI